MAKWKLCRQTFGNEEFDLSEGEKVTIGRGLNNTITLSSIVVSRNHCLINVKRDEVSITDLKSSNGIYVGLKRIPPNVPYILTDADVIGFGWTIGASLAKVNDNEKFIFKLEKCISSITSRIQFQDNALDDIEAEMASFDAIKSHPSINVQSPMKSKLQLKRKLNLKFEVDEISNQILITESPKVKSDEIINLTSDSDNETKTKRECALKKIKLEHPTDDETKQDIKCEKDNFEYEAFNVKQEYLGYDDEPIEINSDSDSDSQHWYRRLSQSSPGKPLSQNERIEKRPFQSEDGSYSQLDDVSPDVIENNDDDNDNEEEFLDDLISIPLEPLQNHFYNKEHSNVLHKEKSPVIIPDVKFENVIASNTNVKKDDKRTITPVPLMKINYNNNSSEKEIDSDFDSVDKISSITDHSKVIENVEPITTNNRITKKAQMIEPLIKITKRKSYAFSLFNVSENKSKSSHKSSKSKKHSSPHKKKITNSQKEERKKKLKEIACKDKDCDDASKDLANNASKPVVNVKVTGSNRGAFLSDVNQACVKPMKRKNSPLKGKEKNIIGSPKNEHQLISTNSKISIKSDKYIAEELRNTTEICQQKESNHKPNSNSGKFRNNIDSNTIIPFKGVKPLTENKESYLGKPISKVEPLPPEKPKKHVRFTNAPPEVYEFEIEPGNRMRKTGSVKTALIDVQKMKIFSLEKVTLITILRWNPHWLNEQMTISEPPPILNHKNPPMAVFHSFSSHKEYVGVIGDLLLMEIWECITQAYNRIKNQSKTLQLRIESCPASEDRYMQLSNIIVNLSIPTSDIQQLPRIGEIMTVEFGPEQSKISRFVYVHNVRNLPSPPNNVNSFFSISLYAAFTEKMKSLRPGGLVIGRTLAYIKNELMLFEAIEYLAGSPLSNAILRPDPYHFPRTEFNDKINIHSQWTLTLNESQKLAVSNTVTAALGDRPSIQLVQGPPGTGKSSVICSMVMTYFYDVSGNKQQNRSKILICATSNAAVDGLVIKLLKIRQSLPRSERFRMVRVGRLEAMHECARNVSSQNLAQRDAARAHCDSAHPGLNEEISHLDAKINMWKTAARDAKDPERVAYCQTRVDNMTNRLFLLRNSSGTSTGAVAGERLVQAERRTIEGADIIVTTLASSHNYKMKVLKGRIALCIVDEAGQAIEPEALIPLTLDVTRITLIGDPQQLPGYICSQRAKKHGLGESLFSRLTSCSEHWEQNPVVLLNLQYRMHAAIAEYPNRAFYDGLVHSAPPPSVGLDVPPYLVVGISSGDKGQGTSGANEMEAWGVARLAMALVQRTRERHLSLAVITPYSAHRDLLRDNLRSLKSDSRVEVNTVDSFQGQERDVVLVSLARSHGVGFLSDAGRMNVMLTRARYALLICLNSLAFVKNSQWQTLVDDARRRNLYTTLPSKFCQPTSTDSNSSDKILKCVLNPKSSYRK